METQSLKSNKKAETTAGILTWVAQILMATAAAGVILFLSAGRLDWSGGWAFFGLNLFTQALSALILIPRRPDLIAERSHVHAGTKSYDRFFAPAIMIFGTLAVMLIAGLDARYGWSATTNPAIWWAALGIAFASQLFVLWAMASNRFFSTTVRIQTERGHRVVNAGPYHIVRHPGYAGSLVYTLAIPLVLGSWWTFIPAVLTVGLLVARTEYEDRTLHSELPGYRDYATATPYRLIPGVW